MNRCRNLDVEKTGQRIEEAVRGKGYTVRELQELLSFECPNPIYRWFRGITLPSLDNLHILSKLLGVHMEDLLVEREVREVELPQTARKSIWD
ncbi:MAG: helix-turn-helix domain-containing protein [Lachnospiraceae bacterium]|nr:helix-turn-helix domain-containing protein [Lachnospiraceae bacterium]